MGRTSHPAMVTVPDMVAAKHWLRLMRAEQQKDIEGMKYQILQPTLEINPRLELLVNVKQDTCCIENAIVLQSKALENKPFCFFNISRVILLIIDVIVKISILVFFKRKIAVFTYRN